MTVRTDTYAPDFRIEVNGQVFLHGMTADTTGANVDIISVSITETINKPDSFSIAVREHNPEPGRFAGDKLTWLDHKVFDEESPVEIELGYRGNRGVKLIGRIKGMNVDFPESGAPTLKVRGLSLYDDLFRKTRRKPFDQKTDSQIASELAKDAGLQANVETTNVIHPLVSPEGATYAAFLQKRAQRLNFEVAVKQKALVFRRPTYLVDNAPALTLWWGRDLRSFTPDVATGKLVSQVEVRNTQTGQGGAKKPLVGRVTATQVPARLGAKSGLALSAEKFGLNTFYLDDQQVNSQEEAVTVARAELERRAIEYITGRGSCIGNPQLASRTVIHLKGLGSRFSGTYYVTSTTHSIDANGYRTEFEVKRDGR